MGSFIPYNALLGVEKDYIGPENTRFGSIYTCIINMIAWPESSPGQSPSVSSFLDSRETRRTAWPSFGPTESC